jgi:hypothetical protein
MFASKVTAYPLSAADLERITALDSEGCELWVGVNPVVGPPGRTGRGTSEQVTRLFRSGDGRRIPGAA